MFLFLRAHSILFMWDPFHVAFVRFLVFVSIDPSERAAARVSADISPVSFQGRLRLIRAKKRFISLQLTPSATKSNKLKAEHLC